jgi:hypothetical protein
LIRALSMKPRFTRAALRLFRKLRTVPHVNRAPGAGRR